MEKEITKSEKELVVELSTQDTIQEQVSDVDIEALAESRKKDMIEEEVNKIIDELDGRTIRGPNKLTKEAIKKLREAFSIDLNVLEACAYAGIGQSTFYDWTKKYRTLADMLQRMQQRLPIASKRNIAEKIQGSEQTPGDIGLSKWLLERKQGKEYGETLNINPSKEDDVIDKAGLTRDERQELNDVYHDKMIEIVNRKKKSENNNQSTHTQSN